MLSGILGWPTVPVVGGGLYVICSGGGRVLVQWSIGLMKAVMASFNRVLPFWSIATFLWCHEQMDFVIFKSIYLFTTPLTGTPSPWYKITLPALTPNHMVSPGSTSANGDFVWFDPVNAVTAFSEAAHKGQKWGVPTTSVPVDLKTVPPIFDSASNHAYHVLSPGASSAPGPSTNSFVISPTVTSILSSPRTTPPPPARAWRETDSFGFEARHIPHRTFCLVAPFHQWLYNLQTCRTSLGRIFQCRTYAPHPHRIRSRLVKTPRYS